MPLFTRNLSTTASSLFTHTKTHTIDMGIYISAQHHHQQPTNHLSRVSAAAKTHTHTHKTNPECGHKTNLSTILLFSRPFRTTTARWLVGVTRRFCTY